MKQKIKKLSYLIPLKSNAIKKGNIEVSAFNIPNQSKQNTKAVSIKVNISDASGNTMQNEQSITIPKNQIKALKKINKKF